MPSLADLQVRNQILNSGESSLHGGMEAYRTRQLQDQAQAEKQKQMDEYKMAAAEAAQLWQSGDKKAAIGKLMQVDPKLAGQVFGYAGEQEVDTDLEQNKAQIQKRDIEAGKFAQQSSKEARLGNQFNQNLGFKYQQAAEKSKSAVAAQGVLDEIPQLKVLLDDAYKNGGQSLAMLGPRIAKGLAGEVGVLTEQDVTRYVRNPALAQWIISGAEKKFEGKLTPQDYSNLMRLGTLMQENAQVKLQSAYKRAAKNMSRNMKIPLEDAELLVNPTIDEDTKNTILEAHPQAQTVTVIAPDGSRGTIPADQLQDALNQGYKKAE